MDNKSTKPKGTFAKLMQSTHPSVVEEAITPITPRVEEKSEDIEKKNERTLERKNVRTNEQKKERILKHHSFDVYIDQLISLDQIRTQIYQEKGKKPKIGTLVQEALDEYIKNHKKQEKNGTNESSLERKNVI